MIERKLSKIYYIISTRDIYGDIVFSSDMYYCNLSEHKETNLDNDLFNNYEIAENYFNEILPDPRVRGIFSLQI